MGGTAYTLTNTKGRLSHTSPASGRDLRLQQSPAAGADSTGYVYQQRRQLLLVYNYYTVAANPTTCAVPAAPPAGTQNNGNVVGYFYQDTTNPSLGHTASYTYDYLNRLTSSVATPSQSGGAAHNLTFSEDRYGNMSCVTNASTTGPCPNWSFNTATNQITTSRFTYDLAGNLTQDPSNSPTNAAANPSGDASGVSGTAKPELFTTKQQRRKRKQ